MEDNLKSKSEISLRLKKLRKDLGLKQEQVAEYLDISLNLFKNIEDTGENLSFDILINLSLLYGCPDEYIMLGIKEDYTAPKITISPKEDIDLDAISKMNEIRKYLNLLHKVNC